MTDQPPLEQTQSADSMGDKARKERKKVVAQFVGSAATIGLGAMLRTSGMARAR